MLVSVVILSVFAITCGWLIDDADKHPLASANPPALALFFATLSLIDTLPVTFGSSPTVINMKKLKQ